MYKNGRCLGEVVKVGKECLCAVGMSLILNTVLFLIGEICQLKHHCVLWGLKNLSYHRVPSYSGIVLSPPLSIVAQETLLAHHSYMIF